MHRAALGLTVAACLWTLSLVAAPAALSHASLTVPAAIVYGVSSRVCHQRPERSFHLAGVQLPVCARCLGLYLSSAIGALLAWTMRRVSDRFARTALAIAALPTLLTWALEVMGVATFSNFARAGAALPLGLTAGWVTVQLLRYDSLLHDHEIHHRGSRVHLR